MKKIIIGLSIATATLLSAECVFKDGTPGVKIGTLGIGIEYTAKFNEKLDLRLGVNKYKYSSTGTESNIDYDIDLNLHTLAIIADYHVFNNNFVLSAGLMYNGNNIEFDAKSTSVNIGGTAYTGVTLNGKVDFNSIAPYIGIGYSNTTKGAGWSFSSELGALYQGTAIAKLTTSGTAVTAAHLAAEEKELQDALDGFDLYPVASIAVSYKF